MSQQNDSNNQSNQFGHAAGAIMVVLFIVIIMMIAQESAGVSVAALPRPGFKSPTPTVTSTPTETPMPTATFTPAPTEQPTTEPDANAGASYDPALIAEGESQFILCAACHGLDGRGVPNLGKDLVEAARLHQGRPPDLGSRQHDRRRYARKGWQPGHDR